jgi:hypothetical protein
MDKTLRDFVLKWGLIVGLAQCTVSLISYLMGLEWMVSFTFAFINIIVFIGGPVYAAIVLKKQQGGYIPFKNAFAIIMIVFAAAGFVLLGYNVLMYTVIDPAIPGQVKEAVAEKTFNMMERFGAPEEAIEEAMAEIEDTEMEYTPANLVKGYFTSWLWGAIIALIGAAIIKKNRPVFEEGGE